MVAALGGYLSLRSHSCQPLSLRSGRAVAVVATATTAPFFSAIAIILMSANEGVSYELCDCEGGFPPPSAPPSMRPRRALPPVGGSLRSLSLLLVCRCRSPSRLRRRLHAACPRLRLGSATGAPAPCRLARWGPPPLPCSPPLLEVAPCGLRGER
jgi:hypothetical protein